MKLHNKKILCNISKLKFKTIVPLKPLRFYLHTKDIINEIQQRAKRAKNVIAYKL